LIFFGLYFFTREIASVFTDSQVVIDDTSVALKLVFLAVPIIAIQMIGAAYYQAIGKPMPALILTSLRTGIILIPLILILPSYYGITGVWISFPIADILSTIITAFFLWKAMGKLKTTESEK
jgi:Na+-driven multidrug efflux pump